MASGDASSSPIDGVAFQFNGVELPKIRTVDDFVLDKARFEQPPLNDLARWNNRIISNLLYYQTNYFVFILAVFLLFSLFNARDFVIGFCALGAIGATGYFALSPNSMFIQTRRDHPLVTLGAIVVSFYFFIYTIQSVLVLLFSLLVPLLFVLAHASTRLRNFRAKVNQQAERLGLQTTVMSRILALIGCDPKA